MYVGQKNITNENAVSRINGEPIDDKIEPSNNPASPSRKWKWQGAEYVTNEKAVSKIWNDKPERKQATNYNEIRWIIREELNTANGSKKLKRKRYCNKAKG